MSWSIPLFRAFGIPVKVHILFFVVTLGLFFRQVMMKDNAVWWFDVFAFTILLLFGIVLLHEFGHCFGGRYVGGEATEILIWPLGGLAFIEVPQNPRAHLITVAAGPAVNVLLCLATAGGMMAAGFWPNANPLSNPYVAEIKNFNDGKTYTSPYGVRAYDAATGQEVVLPELFRKFVMPTEVGEAYEKSGYQRALAPTAVVWLQRAFWLSGIMLLFNLLPAFPLDGGQLLQGVIWARTGSYRQGTVVAVYGGFVTTVLLLIVSLARDDTLMLMLALFIYMSCAQKIQQLDQDNGVFGYDFSAGYTSLERDDPPPPRAKKLGPVKRWLQARQARKMHRENEERARDEERMDQLLDRIAKNGKDSLTDDDRRFMQRVSARYRNRS